MTATLYVISNQSFGWPLLVLCVGLLAFAVAAIVGCEYGTPFWTAAPGLVVTFIGLMWLVVLAMSADDRAERECFSRGGRPVVVSDQSTVCEVTP